MKIHPDTTKILDNLKYNAVDSYIFLFYYTELMSSKNSLYKLADPVGSKKHLQHIRMEIRRQKSPEKLKNAFDDMPESTFRGKAKRMEEIIHELSKLKEPINPYNYVSKSAVVSNPSCSAFAIDSRERIRGDHQLYENSNLNSSIIQEFENLGLNENIMRAANSTGHSSRPFTTTQSNSYRL